MRFKPLPYLPPLLGAEDTIWFKRNWRENENYIHHKLYKNKYWLLDY